MQWVVFAGLSALAYALWAFFWRVGTVYYSWREILFFAALSEMAVALGVAWPAKLPPLPAIGFGVVAGLAAAVGYILFTWSMAGARSSLPIVVMSMYPVLALVLARLILLEAISWDRWLGVGLAMVAVYLVVR